MSKTMTANTHFGQGLKRIKERLYGDKGLRKLLEEGKGIEARKVFALVDRALDHEIEKKNYVLDEKIESTVKEYLNMFDDVIPRPAIPENLETEVNALITEISESQIEKNKIKALAREQASFLATFVRSPKTWAWTVWMVVLYFLLKRYFH